MQAAQTNTFNTDFPFEQIRKSNGDYFDSIDQAKAAGYEENQIWSVTECDDVWSYGPSHHYINLVGYIATAEKHDSNTYYIEDESESFED